MRKLTESGGVSYSAIALLGNRDRTANPSTVRVLAAGLVVGLREPMGRGGG